MGCGGDCTLQLMGERMSLWGVVVIAHSVLWGVVVMADYS